MEEGIANRLRDMLSARDTGLMEDPQRLEAILRDHFPGSRREIHLVVSAMKSGLVEELTQSWGTSPAELLIARLAQRLHEEMGISPSLARWAIETWTYALFGARFKRPATPVSAGMPSPAPGAQKAAPDYFRGGVDSLRKVSGSIAKMAKDRQGRKNLALISAGALIVLLVGAMVIKKAISSPSSLAQVQTRDPAASATMPIAETPAGEATEDPQGSSEAENRREDDGKLTADQARALLQAQFPTEELQVTAIVYGSFTSADTSEALFAATSSGYNPAECRSRLWLASASVAWHLVGDVMPKVTSISQVVDVDKDGVSEVLVSYSCTFRGNMEETCELVSLKDYPLSKPRRLYSVTERGPVPAGQSSANSTLIFHELRFREYPGESSPILRDEATDPVTGAKTCRNFRLRGDRYEPAEDLQGCT